MTSRIHTKIAGTIAVLVIAAVAPSAAMGATNGSHSTPQLSIQYTEPGSTGYVTRQFSINYTEPGSTGYVPQAKFSLPYTEPGSTGYVPQRFSISYSEPGSTGWVPVVATSAAASASGFDWASALIGAGAAFGVAVACAGGLTALRRRRALAHA